MSSLLAQTLNVKLNFWNWIFNEKNLEHISGVFRPVGDQYTSLGDQKILQAFFFLLYFNDFTMHLIISTWLRRQKCRQEKNNETKRCWSKRRNCIQKYFIHLNNRSSKCSLFLLRKWFTLLPVTPSVLVATPFLLRLICRSHKVIAT